MEELLARLRAIIRRAAGQVASVLQVGPLSLDPKQMRVTKDGQALNLSPQEYRLISYLMHHAGRVVTQIELTEHLYAQDFERDSNAIEVLVGRVRKKLGPDLIETRRGFGYVMSGSDS
jgi:DNA-binding response OmpR family regulator